MQLKYHDQAVSKGIHIVGTCGFDSIPADMGVVFAQENFPGFVDQFVLSHSQPYSEHVVLNT